MQYAEKATERSRPKTTDNITCNSPVIFQQGACESFYNQLTFSNYSEYYILVVAESATISLKLSFPFRMAPEQSIAPAENNPYRTRQIKDATKHLAEKLHIRPQVPVEPKEGHKKPFIDIRSSEPQKCYS